MRRFLLLIICAGFTSQRLHAQTSENPDGENFRERCRKIIAGAYVNAFNDERRAREGLGLASTTQKKLRDSEKIYVEKLRAVETKLKNDHYDPAMLQERDMLAGQIRTFHEQALAQEESTTKLKKEASTAAELEKKLHRKLVEIFDVKFVDDPTGLPQKLFHELVWKSPCPQFRVLCPLPESHRIKLISILDDVQDQDQVCMKYSKIR